MLLVWSPSPLGSQWAPLHLGRRSKSHRKTRQWTQSIRMCWVLKNKHDEIIGGPCLVTSALLSSGMGESRRQKSEIITKVIMRVPQEDMSRAEDPTITQDYEKQWPFLVLSKFVSQKNVMTCPKADYFYFFIMCVHGLCAYMQVHAWHSTYMAVRGQFCGLGCPFCLYTSSEGHTRVVRAWEQGKGSPNWAVLPAPAVNF